MIRSIFDVHGIKVECSPCVRKVVGSSPGRVLPRTLKMVHTAPLSSTRHFWERVWEGRSVTVVCGVSHEVLHLRGHMLSRVVRDSPLYIMALCVACTESQCLKRCDSYPLWLGPIPMHRRAYKLINFSIKQAHELLKY